MRRPEENRDRVQQRQERKNIRREARVLLWYDIKDLIPGMFRGGGPLYALRAGLLDIWYDLRVIARPGKHIDDFREL